MSRLPVVSLLALLLPPIVVGFTYFQFLGHRSDYLGHFLAGFGGTLGAVALSLALLSMMLMGDGTEYPLTWPSAAQSPRSGARCRAQPSHGQAGRTVVIVVLACIGLGAIFEETLYHIAKWDEVDFCNQSLGAVLAGLAALASRAQSGMPPHPAFGYPLAAEGGEGINVDAAQCVQANVTWALVAGAWGAIVLAGGYYFAFR